jgi:DNA (cytosine-5)-methyltransferase 1
MMKGLFNADGTPTRSGLFFEALRIIESTKPKVAIAENVKMLTSKKFAAEFRTVLESLDQAGYNNHWAVLNAKDYGVPQNRERVFIVSIRKDIDTGSFSFPAAFPLKVKLKNIVEDEVDEEYFVKKELTRKLVINCDITEPQVLRQVRSEHGKKIRKQYESGEVVEPWCNMKQLEPRTDGISNTISTVLKDNYLLVKEATKSGYAEAHVGDSINFEHPNSKTRRGRVGKQVAQTLTTSPQQGVVLEGLRIRYFTPRECFRLMGFSDDAFDKAASVVSERQLYKQAGNSIVVDVLEELFCMMLDESGELYT